MLPHSRPRSKGVASEGGAAIIRESTTSEVRQSEDGLAGRLICEDLEVGRVDDDLAVTGDVDRDRFA